MNWQPIDTAPQDDETPIIVSDGETVEGAKWANGRWVAHTGTTSVWEGSGDRGGLADTRCEPRLWQPFPAPPQEKE